MNKTEITEKLKEAIVYTFKNPFDTGVAIALYIIGAAAGAFCVLAAIAMAMSMIGPLFQGMSIC